MDPARALGTQDADSRRVPRTPFREGRRDFSNLHEVTQETKMKAETPSPASVLHGACLALWTHRGPLVVQ